MEQMKTMKGDEAHYEGINLRDKHTIISAPVTFKISTNIVLGDVGVAQLDQQQLDPGTVVQRSFTDCHILLSGWNSRNHTRS